MVLPADAYCLQSLILSSDSGGILLLEYNIYFFRMSKTRHPQPWHKSWTSNLRSSTTQIKKIILSVLNIQSPLRSIVN